MIKRKDGDSKRFLLMVLMILGLFTVASCATTSTNKYSHGIAMKGSIVAVTDKGLALSIGSLDGAMVGQEMEVWRTTYGVGSKASTEMYSGEVSSGEVSEAMVGKIKITYVRDGHFSFADIISGTARIHDTVEVAM
jgi:hypothetical protein